MVNHKLRYELDPHNRLVAHLNRFRKVLDGKFKIGPNNSLIYHVKAPEGQHPKAPHQVKLRGNWLLTKQHNLKLTLNNWHRQTLGDELSLQGEIIEAKANSLLFCVTTRNKDGVSTNILKLQGRWQADKHNRITFRVKKEAAKYDTLTFDGRWEVDKRHNLIYRYENRRGKGKSSITFKGRWDIRRPHTLTYDLNLDRTSGFDFRTGIGRLEKNSIKYEVGIGAKPVKQTVVLYGKWKLRRNVGLTFELEESRDKRPQVIRFGADARLTKRDRVVFKLKNELGKDLGLQLKLSRTLLGADGQAFLKLLRSDRETSISIGVGCRW